MVIKREQLDGTYDTQLASDGHGTRLIHRLRIDKLGGCWSTQWYVVYGPTGAETECSGMQAAIRVFESASK